jgi:hypothetical protein
MMRSNTRRWDHDDSAGLARRGTGLLAGLLRCGRCGRKLHVRYWGRSGTSACYLCSGDYESGGRRCLGFSGRVIDRRVADAVLHVVSPVDASLDATQQLEDAHAARRALLVKQLSQVESTATVPSVYAFFRVMRTRPSGRGASTKMRVRLPSSAVLGEPPAPRERERQHPLAQPALRWQHPLGGVGAGGGDAFTANRARLLLLPRGYTSTKRSGSMRIGIPDAAAPVEDSLIARCLARMTR